MAVEFAPDGETCGMPGCWPACERDAVVAWKDGYAKINRVDLYPGDRTRTDAARAAEAPGLPPMEIITGSRAILLCAAHAELVPEAATFLRGFEQGEPRS